MSSEPCPGSGQTAVDHILNDHPSHFDGECPHCHTRWRVDSSGRVKTHPTQAIAGMRREYREDDE